MFVSKKQKHMEFTFKTRRIAREFRKGVKISDGNIVIYKIVKKEKNRYFSPFYHLEYEIFGIYDVKLKLKINCERDMNNKAIRCSWKINIDSGIYGFSTYKKASELLKRGEEIILCSVRQGTKYLEVKNGKYHDMICESVCVLGPVQN